MAGLAAIAEEIEDGQIEVVAIHDGARPFMSHVLLESVLTTAKAAGGAIPTLPMDEPVFLARVGPDRRPGRWFAGARANTPGLRRETSAHRLPVGGRGRLHGSRYRRDHRTLHRSNGENCSR